MQLLGSILAGVAASALFWIINQVMLSLPTTIQLAGMAGLFVLAAVGFWISQDRLKSRARILSDSKFGEGLDAKIERVSVEDTGGEVDVASGNKVRGKAKIDIKDMSIKD